MHKQRTMKNLRIFANDERFVFFYLWNFELVHIAGQRVAEQEEIVLARFDRQKRHRFQTERRVDWRVKVVDVERERSGLDVVLKRRILSRFSRPQKEIICLLSYHEIKLDDLRRKFVDGPHSLAGRIKDRHALGVESLHCVVCVFHLQCVTES